MEIEVSTLNTMALLKLSSSNLIEGVSVTVAPITEERDLSESWNIALFAVAASVPANVLAGLILKKFGKDPRRTKIRINRREVEYSEGEIIRTIEETKKIEHE